MDAVDAVEMKIASVDGVEVIAVEPAIGPHPRYRDEKPILMKGQVKALLADGQEVYVCLEPGCNYHNGSPVSVQAHRGATHDRSAPPHPNTPIATIKAVIREVVKAKQEGIRGYAAHAASQLNAQGVKSASNKPWASHMVSSIFSQYAELYPVRVRARRPTGGQPVATEYRSGDVVDRNDLQILVAELREHHDKIGRILVELGQIAKRAGVDPDIEEKAKQFDALRSMLNGSL